MATVPTYGTDSNSLTGLQKIFNISSTLAQRQFRLKPNASTTLSYHRNTEHAHQTVKTSHTQIHTQIHCFNSYFSKPKLPGCPRDSQSPIILILTVLKGQAG